jgi:hypothetical protein
MITTTAIRHFGKLVSTIKPVGVLANRILLIIAVMQLLICGANAANHFILPSGSGSHSGADWSDACVGFSGACNPSSMVRGDTYYVGSGSYSAITFTTPESGSSLITIKGATTADHGTTVGWSSSYGVDAGPAQLRYPLSVYKGYVVFDGNTGTGTNGSSYGFTITIPTCSNVSDVNIGQGGTTIYSVRLSHFYFPGCVADTQTQAISLQTTTTANSFTYSYNYFNDWQVAIFDYNGTNLTIDHNIITNGQSYSDHHGNLLDFVNSETNVTVSNNQVINCAGTVCMGANDTGSICTGGVSGAIYGNVFSTASSIGNGIVGATSRCYFTNTLVYNNTFTGTSSELPWFQGCVAGTSPCGDATANIVEDNIVWNAACAISSGSGIATHDYNSYLSCIDTPPTEAHGQVAKLNPFVNASAENYQLATNAVSSCSTTTATCTGLSLPTSYSVDPNGDDRSISGMWDRGAFAYEPTNTPQPPVSLTVQLQTP